MAFRFFRRLRLAPGLTLNLSRSGGSLSLGPRGAKVTVGRRGVRRTVGLPGTGMFYTKNQGWDGGSNRAASRGGGSRRSRRAGSPRSAGASAARDAHAAARAEDRLTLGFFRRLVTPKREEHFADGMRQLVAGDDAAALRHLNNGALLADAAFMAGVLSMKRGRLKQAERHLTHARNRASKLGHYFAKYGVSAAVTLPITEQVAAVVGAEVRGVLLALAEVHQKRGRWRDAVADLEQLHRRDPADIVVKLSLAELLVEEAGDRRAAKRVVRLAEGVTNRSELHAAVLLYKAKALRLLGLCTAARDTLTAALRRRKNRPADLLHALRYERVLVYESLGHGRRARSDLEKLYAEAPTYEDVAKRLGLGGQAVGSP